VSVAKCLNQSSWISHQDYHRGQLEEGGPDLPWKEDPGVNLTGTASVQNPNRFFANINIKECEWE